MRRARSLRLIAGIAAAALALSACGSSDTPTATSTTSSSAMTSASEPMGSESMGSESMGSESMGSESVAPTGGGEALEVGLAFDTGGRGDGTFNDSAAEGADRAESELGVTVTELEATSDDDRPTNLTLLASQGNNPIIAVGFAFSDSLATIAPQFPDTTFAVVDGYVDAPNVINLGFAAEQGSFLVGAAAALKSTTGHIGFIGGQDSDLIKQFQAGYIAGAKAVNPDIMIEESFLGAEGDNTAWGKPDAAKTIAANWYSTGVDIVYSAAGGSGQGTIEAAVEAGEGKWAIGVDSDQYGTATPEQQAHILTSMLKRVDESVFQTVQNFQNGDTAGGSKLFDLSVDGVGYSTSGGFIDEFVPQLEDFKAKIISGEIVVPTDPTQA